MNDQDQPDTPKPSETTEAAGTTAPTKTYIVQPDDLHDLFEVKAPANPEDEDPLAALRDDPNYKDLIRDLEYIAREAKNLFNPVQEAPRDELWDKIKSHLPTGTSQA